MRSWPLLAVLALTLVSAAAADTTFTTIDDPHAPVGYTTPSGINDGGDIVGTYRAGTVVGDPLHGFLLRGGSYTTIDEPNAKGVTLRWASMRRVMSSASSASGGVLSTHGFLLHQGTYTTIDAPGAAVSPPRSGSMRRA